MITLTLAQTMNGAGAFTLIESKGKKYICPRWIEVPMETKLEDIVVIREDSEPPRVDIPQDKEWTFQGSKGNEYTVARSLGEYTCTCPASMFQKFKDCKHILQAKKEG